MKKSVGPDPLDYLLAALPPASPTADAEARIRRRCHDVLSRQRARQRPDHNGFTMVALRSAFVCVSVFYLAGAVAEALRLLGGLE